MRYPDDLRNRLVSSILAKEITIADASKKYGIGTSTLHSWINSVRKATAPEAAGREAMPLPTGMTLSEAIESNGYIKVVGCDSAEAGRFCRSRGVTLEEMKKFGSWYSAHNAVVLEGQARSREKELMSAVARYQSSERELKKELRRKDKALAETAALLTLSKKAMAIWGDRDE